MFFANSKLISKVLEVPKRTIHLMIYRPNYYKRLRKYGLKTRLSKKSGIKVI